MLSLFARVLKGIMIMSLHNTLFIFVTVYGHYSCFRNRGFMALYNHVND